LVQNVFKRVEQKYLLNEEKFLLLQDMLHKYFFKDKYYESSIFNLYFDNTNNDIIINSIEKPKYKDKIRVRSYGKVKNNDMVFLEMKQKYNGVVYKRRVNFTFSEYKNYIKKGILSSNDNQMLREIDYYIKYYHLKPYVFVGYDRLSYYSKEDKNFRVTFDTNLRSRFNDLRLVDTKENKLYFDEKMYIMEVKSLYGLPLWLIKVLSSNGIYPVSFSKVGSIYKKEREVLC